MKIAFFGGSFNPPHMAHVMACAYILSTAEVDGIWIVPCFHHAFDKQTILAPFDHRVEMCRLAFALFGERVSISTVEKDLEGVSYTIDTLTHLHRKHPEIQFRLAIGTDVLHESHLWKAFDEVVRLAPPLVLGRAGVHGKPEWQAGPELPGISSTEIREKIHRGLPVTTIVPASVLSYIHAYHLYGTGEGA